MLDATYHAYIKAPTKGAPIVFTFHGTGGDETQFSPLVAEILPEAGIVSPRGDVSEFGALRFFRRTGEGVYDMDDLAVRTAKMAGFIASQKAAFPEHPVYGLGYSNGANILASVLLVRPDLFDRAVLLHPLIPWKPNNNAGLKDKRILVTAGARDPIAPQPLTDELVAYFARQQVKVETEIHPGGHEVRPEEIEALQTFLTAKN